MCKRQLPWRQVSCCWDQSVNLWKGQACQSTGYGPPDSCIYSWSGWNVSRKNNSNTKQRERKIDDAGRPAVMGGQRVQTTSTQDPGGSLQESMGQPFRWDQVQQFTGEPKRRAVCNFIFQQLHPPLCKSTSKLPVPRTRGPVWKMLFSCP